MKKSFFTSHLEKKAARDWFSGLNIDTVVSWFSFTETELIWLEKLKDHIANSVEIERDDFGEGELAKMGGIGKASKVFGRDRLGRILADMNAKIGG